MFEHYQGTELEPAVRHSYQTWQSSEQDQKQRRPEHYNKTERNQ